jgi:ribosome biogenesis GTPase A
VIPAKLNDQEAAFKLAICDDIGDASYDNQRVAAVLVDLLNYLEATATSLLPVSPLQSRYGLDSTPVTGEEYLHVLADKRNQGDVERTARQLLTDFRRACWVRSHWKCRPTKICSLLTLLLC